MHLHMTHARARVLQLHLHPWRPSPFDACATGRGLLGSRLAPPHPPLLRSTRSTDVLAKGLGRWSRRDRAKIGPRSQRDRAEIAVRPCRVAARSCRDRAEIVRDCPADCATLAAPPARRLRSTKTTRSPAKPLTRRGRDAAEWPPSGRRDAAEMPPRCHRDATEMPPRCRRDDMCGGDAAEMRPRYTEIRGLLACKQPHRDRAEIAPRSRGRQPRPPLRRSAPPARRAAGKEVRGRREADRRRVD